ncbi:MAG: beta-galactosidase, partial [Kiritimatiellae bacterium]|nr:beta-galactosidase [Kiritimatiellia bacterium]
MKRVSRLYSVAVSVCLWAGSSTWAEPVKPLAVLDFSTGESLNMQVAGPAPARADVAGNAYAELVPQRVAQPVQWDPKMPNPAFPAVDRSGDQAAPPPPPPPRLVLDLHEAQAGLLSPTNLAFVVTVYDMTERPSDSARVSLLGVKADRKPVKLDSFSLSGDPYQREPLLGVREVRKILIASGALLANALDGGDVALETQSRLLIRRIEVYLLPPSPLDEQAERRTALLCTIPQYMPAKGVLNMWRRDYSGIMIDQTGAYADWIDAQTAAREAARHSSTAPAGANKSARSQLAKAADELDPLVLDVLRAMDNLFYDGKVALIRQDADAYRALLAASTEANQRLRAAARQVKDTAAHQENNLRAALAAAGWPVASPGTDLEPEDDYLDRIRFALFANSPWDYMDPFDAAGRTARYLGIDAKMYLRGGGTLDSDRRLVEKPHSVSKADRARGWDMIWGVGHHMSHTMQGFPTWFLEKNPDPYDRDYKGAKVGWDIFNPEVQTYFQDMLTGIAQVFAGNPHMPPYFYWGEPMSGKGYSAAARRSFAEYLKARHGDIDALNTAWGSSNASFDAISPPPPPDVALRTSASGLTYDFEKFRRDTLNDWTRAGAAALRRGNPAAKFWFEGWGRYDYLLSHGMDQYGLFKASGLSAVHTGSMGQDAQRVLGMALSQYTGTPLSDGEINIYGPYYNGSSSLSMLRAAAESHVLMQCWYDTRLFLFWYDQFFIERATSYSGARLYDGSLACPMSPSAFSIRTVRQKADIYNGIIRATKPVNPKVGILFSSTSFINSWPYNETEHETYPLHAWLFNSDFGYTIVPEDAIMDGKEDLQGFNVVLAPWAAWLQPKAAAALLDFVRLGGVLISSGPVGAFDQYGKPLNTILDATLGPVEVAYAANERTGETRLADESVALLQTLGDRSTTHFGGWAWKIDQKTARPEARIVLKLADGTPAAFEAPYGYGKVIVATGPLGKNGLRRFVMNEIERRVAPLVRKSCDDGFHVMCRVDAADNLYLGVFNQNTERLIADTLLVDGHYDSVTDIGLSGAWPVRVSRQGDRTAVPLTLAPGEGTVLAMGSM